MSISSKRGRNRHVDAGLEQLRGAPRRLLKEAVKSNILEREGKKLHHDPRVLTKGRLTTCDLIRTKLK